MQILACECDPDNLKFELDVCWMAVGRQSTVTFFRQNPGRVPLLHLKQINRLPPLHASFSGLLEEIADVGPGVVDWVPILAELDVAGVEHIFVEHDQPTDPMASIARSLDYLSDQYPQLVGACRET
ncbi:sugar phosphate isomerase/epimerase [Jeongeupia wiesaeckerbachi]|uniref:sugar phosphate isomerase/epimerase family protein n=1 Tax=Jeongeupia wiesaeckerbachi TaxID=3051218 RepID=UPI003D803A3D